MLAACGLRTKNLHHGSKSSNAAPAAETVEPPRQRPATTAPAAVAVPLRDRFGDLLPPGAVARLGTVRFRATAFAHAIAAAPDGEAFASGHLDGILRVFDASSGALLSSWPAHADGVVEVLWSGDTIYTGGRDGKLIAWDREGKKIRETIACDGEISALAIAPDGKTIAAGCPAKEELRLLDAEKLERSAPLLGHGDRVDAIVFSPDGARLAAGGYGRTIVVREINGRAVATLKRGAPIFSLAFAPDGKTIAAGGEDAQIALFELSSKKQRHKFSAHTGGVTALIYDDALYSAGADGRIKKFDPRTARELWNSGNSKLQEIAALARLKNKSAIVAGGAGKTFHIYDENSGKNLRALEAHHDLVQAVAFSKDGLRVASASADGTVRTWDARTGEAKLAIEAGAHPVEAVVFTEDDAALLAVDAIGTRHRFDASTGARLSQQAAENPEPRLYVAIAPGGGAIAEVALDGTILHRGVKKQKVAGLAFDAEDRTLLLEPNLRAVNLDTGTTLFELEGATAQTAALSKNTVRLFACQRSKTAQLTAYELENGRVKDQRAVAFPAHLCGRLALSPNEDLLISTAPYMHVRARVGVGEGRWQLLPAPAPLDVAPKLFDPNALEEVYALLGHDGGVEMAAFSPDGTRVATAGQDSTVLIWSLAAVRGK